MHDQKKLNEYFSKHWIPAKNRGISSYEAIAQKLDKQAYILDVGCGSNPLKASFPKLIGIDPASDQAHIKCTIEEYQPHRLFDIALCLGSINFGNIDIIENQVGKVVNCLRENSKIYWRLNPGRQDHNNEQCREITFFPWTLEILEQFALKYNYIQLGQLEHHTTQPRYYAEWKRR